MSLVKWVHQDHLADEKQPLDSAFEGVIPVIPLAALTEVVEGLRELPHSPGCGIFKDLLDGGPFPCSCPKRLLAQLEAHGKEGA